MDDDTGDRGHGQAEQEQVPPAPWVDPDETQPYASPMIRQGGFTPPGPPPYRPPEHGPAPTWAPVPQGPPPQPAQTSYLPQPYYAAPPPMVPAYGHPALVTPYGVDPRTGIPWSDKSRTAAGLLQLLLPFVGLCGIGRLYAGNIGTGLTQLLGFLFGWVLMFVLVGFLVVPAIWVWAVIDGIVLLAGGGRDGLGRRLR